MSENLRWAILGTGNIAKKFAEGLRAVKGNDLVAVGSRSQEVAEAFSGEFGGRPWGSYDEAIAADGVDAVYIALPHHLHLPYVIKAAEAKKAILCEKPFTLNFEEAKQAMEAVRTHKVFFMEAFMYRCHPQLLAVREVLKNGVIGKVCTVHAEFGYASKRPGQHFRIDGSLGGGGLMDVGCYPVSFIRWVAGAEPSRVSYSADIGETGYDRFGIGTMEFESGLKATFQCGVHCQMSNHATIYGENGSITLTDPWFGNGPVLVTPSGGKSEQLRVKSIPHLWGQQAVLVKEFLEKGASPTMTPADTMGNMRALDGMQKSAGLAFRSE